MGEGRRRRWAEGLPPKREDEGFDLKAIVELIAAIAGLAAYVYLVGGVVLWTRLTAAHLPADTGTITAESGRLFLIGFRALVVVALIAVGAAVAVHIGGRVARGAAGRLARTKLVARRQAAKGSAKRKLPADRPGTLGRPAVLLLGDINRVLLGVSISATLAYTILGDVDLPDWRRGVLFVFIAVVLVSLFWCAGRALTSPRMRKGEEHPNPGRRAVVYIGIAFSVIFPAVLGAVALVGVALLLLEDRIRNLPRPDSVADFLRSPVLWGLILVYTAVALTYAGTPPVAFERAEVDVGGKPMTGGYLARTGDGVYLVSCEADDVRMSRRERVTLVPADQVKGVRLGGEAYRVDHGDQPSILTLALRSAGLDVDLTIVYLSLRKRDKVCAGQRPGRGRELAAPEGTDPADPKAHVGVDRPIGETTPRRWADLARRFQPTLKVSILDRFWPTGVANVLHEVGYRSHGFRKAHASTCLVGERRCVAAPPSLGRLERGKGRGEYLDFPAPLTNAQRQFEAFARGVGADPGVISEWPRRPEELAAWRSSQVYFYFAGAPDYSKEYPGVPRGHLVLQYWFYYPFNYYPLIVRGNFLDDPIRATRQNADYHEGDWEHIAVFVDPVDMKPKHVWMARHDYEGQAFEWDSDQMHWEDGHPVVYASFGGHASYHDCGRFPRDKVKGAARGRLVDWVVCGPGLFAFGHETTPLADLERASWSCWEGRWGDAGPALERNASRAETDPRHHLRVHGPKSGLRQGINGRACEPEHRQNACAAERKELESAADPAARAAAQARVDAVCSPDVLGGRPPIS